MCETCKENFYNYPICEGQLVSFISLCLVCVSLSVCACMCNHHCDASVFVSVDSAGHGCGVAVVTEHGT